MNIVGLAYGIAAYAARTEAETRDARAFPQHVMRGPFLEHTTVRHRLVAATHT